jgi:hypothetical protein
MTTCLKPQFDWARKFPTTLAKQNTAIDETFVCCEQTERTKRTKAIHGRVDIKYLPQQIIGPDPGNAMATENNAMASYREDEKHTGSFDAKIIVTFSRIELRKPAIVVAVVLGKIQNTTIAGLEQFTPILSSLPYW